MTVAVVGTSVRSTAVELVVVVVIAVGTVLAIVVVVADEVFATVGTGSAQIARWPKTRSIRPWLFEQFAAQTNGRGSGWSSMPSTSMRFFAASARAPTVRAPHEAVLL